MLADQLRNAWRVREASSPIHAVLKFEAEGLVLGAGTILAEPGADLTPGGAGETRLTTLLAAAYAMFAANHVSAGDKITSTNVSFQIKAGSKWNWANEAFVHTGGYEIPPDPSIITYPIFKAALLAMIAAWPCTWANASAFKMDYWEHSDAPGQPPMPYSIYHLSWMAYLSAERSAKLTPPAGVTWERTPDGGLLLIAAEERFDPTNPLHIQRSRAVVNFMIAQLGDPPKL